MENFLSLIKSRRSIRHFQDRDVPRELLDQVLEAVRWTPSWANTQCWEVIVVQNAETRQRLRETTGKGNPGSEALLQAPVVLAMCGKLHVSGFYKNQATTRHGDWFMFDLGLATQNLCLMAHHLGLGTVILGLFDQARAKEILQVPDDYELLVLIPLGYPDRVTGPPKRKEISRFTHLETFSAEPAE